MVWCDNCLLLLPLRLGAILLATLITAYSIAGGIVLFYWGEFLWFTYPESQIYGGIAMAVAAIAVIAALAFASQSFTWTNVCYFVYPFVMALLAVRMGLMIFRLDEYQGRVLWECSNGRQVWNATLAAMDPVPPPADGVTLIPKTFCKYSWHSVYYAFTFALLADLLLNLYMFFMTWRFRARLIAYSPANMILAGKCTVLPFISQATR